MSLVKLLILLSITTNIAICTLEVTNIAQLPNPLQNQGLSNIPYSIANFGFVPYFKVYLEQGKQWWQDWLKLLASVNNVGQIQVKNIPKIFVHIHLFRKLFPFDSKRIMPFCYQGNSCPIVRGQNGYHYG